MSKYGNLEIDVKIYESKNSEAKAKENGRIFQMMGNPVATISLDGKPLFDKLSGMVGMSYKDNAAFQKDEGQMVVLYNQQYTAETGQQFDKVTVGEYLGALLHVETMKAFAEGFAHSERDEHIAENAGITTDDYLTVAKAAMAKAAALKTAIATTKTMANNEALNALDKDLAANIG